MELERTIEEHKGPIMPWLYWDRIKGRVLGWVTYALGQPRHMPRLRVQEESNRIDSPVPMCPLLHKFNSNLPKPLQTDSPSALSYTTENQYRIF